MLELHGIFFGNNGVWNKIITPPLLDNTDINRYVVGEKLNYG